MNNLVCKACSCNDLHFFKAKEMMYGLRHQFDYGECSKCGSIQILQVPNNLSEYYKCYYSFQGPSPTRKTLRQWLAQQRQQYAQGKFNIVGLVASFIFGNPLYTEMDWVNLVGPRLEDSVLDVGCGAGNMLASMEGMGFLHLTGIDPNLESDIQKNGFKLIKKDLSEFDGTFDLIMLHHSFEHMEDPLQAMREIYRLLDEDGVVLLRTPVANSYAWRNYGPNWFQLDAPRHLFIPSLKGLYYLAEVVGFDVTKVVFDSNYMQFTISEKYGRNISLSDPDTKSYSKHELRGLSQKASELNENSDGDQAGFILRKKRT